jgi:hypothetical protein
VSSLALEPLHLVRLTLRISCEAVRPSVPAAGAHGGTSACSTGAAVSFVSCIRLLGCPPFSGSDRTVRRLNTCSSSACASALSGLPPEGIARAGTL